MLSSQHGLSFIHIGYRASSFLFFFNDTATTEIYTLSLHDALPISVRRWRRRPTRARSRARAPSRRGFRWIARYYFRAQDRKSTRLNSSHDQISYAVFCLKKKKMASIYLRQPQCPVVSQDLPRVA